MSAVSHTRVRLSKRERSVSKIRNGVRSRTLARAPDFGDATINVVVTPNTIVKAYGELESSGVVHKRRGSGTFVSEGRQQPALRERRRIIEQRIDALLAEAHQLNFTADDILRMVRERRAAMDPATAAEPADVEKPARRAAAGSRQRRRPQAVSRTLHCRLRDVLERGLHHLRAEPSPRAEFAQLLLGRAAAEAFSSRGPTHSFEEAAGLSRGEFALLRNKP
jgi:GntR family transcriptional regulator